jgi:membrane-associated phospholipid phosphatase
MQVFAKIISALFHPLLVLSYMLTLFMLINPYAFGIHHLHEPYGLELLLRVFLSSFFIPFVAILMLRFTGLVQSLEMPERQDRIVPYIVTGIFYLWLFRNLLDNTMVPSLFTSFALGTTIALFLAFFINLFSKISIHAVGMGGLIGMIILLMVYFPDYSTVNIPLGQQVLQISTTLLLLATLLLAGLVGTARLSLKAHVPMDLYGGYFIGFSAQMIGSQF